MASSGIVIGLRGRASYLLFSVFLKTAISHLDLKSVTLIETYAVDLIRTGGAVERRRVVDR